MTCLSNLYLSMPCLSNLYLSMPCLSMPCLSILSFSILISPPPASPSSAPQQDCLYPHQQRHVQPTSCPSKALSNVSNTPLKDKVASVHQRIYIYFKLSFQALPENSCRLMSLPEKSSTASYLDWKGQISRNKEQWKVLISRLFRCGIKT